MGCCTSTTNQSASNGPKHGNEETEPAFLKKASRLIPYSDDDPIEEKIKKIYLRWRMNKKNIIEYMSMLKFDSILQISITNHLPPNNDIEYDSVEHLMDILQQNEIHKSIFCQYWKMEKYIASEQVIQRHIDLLFKFKKWKVEEQLSYVKNSDLELFEQYNPIINTKTIITQHMKMGDILVVLTPRWHETRKKRGHNNNNSTMTMTNEDSIIKVHSFTPFTVSNKENKHITPHNTATATPFKLKLFAMKSPMSASDETVTADSKENSYNAIYSDLDNEEILSADSNSELIPIKLTDFQKYITMQAMCLAVTISERQLLTLKTHSKLKSVTLNNLNNNTLNINNEFRPLKPSKKLTDLQEDVINEISLIHHDTKLKYNRFYFTLCTDRTSALLKIQELVIKINAIIDDLSFLYSIVVQASQNNCSASQYIASIKQSANKQYLLSLRHMQQASFINICGGLAKYWSDIDDQRSIIKRVQSALQFSALGSVFMYPKDYAARTKWKIGDSVMIFKQDIAKWCPGKITKLYLKTDDIQVKYAVLYNSATPSKNIPMPPPLMQGNEDENQNGNQNQQSFDDIEISQAINSNINSNNNNKRIAKVTFVSNIMSNDSVRGSLSNDYIAPFSPTATEQRGAFKSEGSKGTMSGSSRIDIMDASKLAKIDFINDTTLESIKLNRYNRDFVRPMVIKNQKRASLSVTIDNKVNRTSELLDMVTGLSNAVRLNDRLQNICNDEILSGIMDVNDEKNDENENEKEEKKVLRAKNIHPIALMLIEIDQLSSKINLNNRQSDMIKLAEKYCDEKYNEDFIMVRVSKIMDSIGKRFNKYLSSTQSQHGSENGATDIQSLLESQHSHSRTDSFLTGAMGVSVNEYGKKGNTIKCEAFRYGHNIFALLLHNTDVAKSLLISRFIQKQIKHLCNITTEFKYDEHYLTVSTAIANLHYNHYNNNITDSYRTWYKRCSDALKTIRYEGGNGVTHADVLFGVSNTHTPVESRSPQNSIHGNVEIGILHTAGSATSEPGIAMQFQNSLNENHFNALASFNNNLFHNLNEDDLQSPSHKLNVNLSPSIEPLPNAVQVPKIQNPTSPISRSDTNNKTITWITGRLDRKYTFV